MHPVSFNHACFIQPRQPLMNLIVSRLALFSLFFVVLFTACDSTEPDIDGPGEEEQITTVVLTFDAGAGSSFEVRWSDPDGDGGAAPTVDDIAVQAGVTYAVRVKFLDASDPSDVEDITVEVSAEAEEHQVFTTAEGAWAGETTIVVTDRDGNGLPLGLEATLVTTAGPGTTGALRVVLSHYDDVAKDGTTRSPETDVEVAFPVTVAAAP